jgi:preprotein translocase subunit SecF
MAVQKTFNNLKQNGSKDDKVAVASGVAISVVVVLLGAWAIFFFRGIRNGSQQINLSGGAQSQFNFQNVTEAQQQLQQQLSSQSQQDLQNQSAQDSNGVMQTQDMQIQGNTNDQFGTGNPAY